MSNTDNDPGRWKLSDVKALVESTGDDGAVLETLSKIAKMVEDEQSSNFILGKVIIENDLLDDDDEEDDDED